MISIAKPLMGEQEVKAVESVLLSGWVAQGPEVRAFEKEFAGYVGAGHACAVSSCTAALHLALKAIGVQPGDEVITVSHSFIATANSIRYCEAVPVFVDIEPGTFNMNAELVERVITKKTRAILCVHQMGMPCNLMRVLDIAKRHGLPVIEDAACAIGSEIQWEGEWRKIGRPQGLVACFSFHPRKVITTGDGGMLTTNDEELDRKFRLWRQHSMSVPDTVRHQSDRVVFEEYTELGYNYRMTDLQAAVGRVQLKRLPEMLERRRELANRYLKNLADIAGLGLPVEPAWTRSNWQSFCLRLPDRVEQMKFMQHMLIQGVATRRGIMCSHREPAFRHPLWSCGQDRALCGCASGTCARLMESEKAQNRCVLIPLYHEMTGEDQDHVISAIRSAYIS
jgi:perosamine synthetase